MTTWTEEHWPGGDVFWLQIVGDFDETACVIAARLFDTDDLKADLRALKIFYANPKGRKDVCHVEGKGIPHMAGKVVCDGNLWVAKRYRDTGVSALAVRLLHAAALFRWDVDWFFGLVELGIACSGVVKAQGYPHCKPLVTWKNTPYNQDFPMAMCWGSRTEIVADLVNHQHLSV